MLFEYIYVESISFCLMKACLVLSCPLTQGPDRSFPSMGNDLVSLPFKVYITCIHPSMVHSPHISTTTTRQGTLGRDIVAQTSDP